MSSSSRLGIGWASTFHVVAQACKPPAYRTLLYYAVAGFPVLLVIKIAGSESAGVADCESLEVMAVGDYALLTTHYSLLTTHYSLLTTHYSLLTTHYSLLTTHYLLVLEVVGSTARC